MEAKEAPAGERIGFLLEENCAIIALKFSAIGDIHEPKKGEERIQI